MKIKYYHIIYEGKIIASNLPESHLNELQSCDTSIKKCVCEIEGSHKRHGARKYTSGLVYLVSYDKNITNKILEHYFDACIFFIPYIIKNKEDIRDGEERNFKRLRHNLISHNANILQYIYNLVPQDSLVLNGKRQTEVIKEIVIKKPDETSRTVLRVLKSANFMKSEFDVFDMINMENPYLEFHKHSAHKITLLNLTPFWLDLIEKGIIIEIGPCHEHVIVDYKSISVALCHLFDNATKYILPNTSFSIYFRSSPKEIDINLEMTSIKITDADIGNIFKENYSGEIATKIGKSGSGLGMNIVKKLIELNHGEISIRRDIDTRQRTKSIVPFERNLFQVKLSK
ncbi:ATP-binding protein [Dawidia soli]|uniref:histidine kinase n=1 Tax=Dawidia soli TaxID=2782352 RepID=A0AAP2DCG4_9BACT|nr:ATP-binding protein [Dawidia soli]MBT1689444.1 sensor histidine kinase [Dawidia soli]